MSISAIIKRVLLALLIIILLAVLAFVGLYFTRFQTMNSIEQLTDYSDGYNLYRMDIKYDYSTEDIIDYGITDYQSFVDAVLDESLPLLPVSI